MAFLTGFYQRSKHCRFILEGGTFNIADSFWKVVPSITPEGEKSTVNASQIHFSAFWIDRDLSPFSTVATEAAPNLLPPTVELIHFLLVLATRELIVTPY